MTHVAYLSHPIGDDDDLEVRGDNISNAGRWLNFLVDNTRWAIMCPWLAYTTAMTSTLYGPRALTDQILLLERCDFLVQVGGSISPHMEIERNHAVRHEIPIINLTMHGDVPSSRNDVRNNIAKALKSQVELVRAVMRRRVWLPPLAIEDIAALRAAEVALRENPQAQEARAMIQRIVHAAIKG